MKKLLAALGMVFCVGSAEAAVLPNTTMVGGIATQTILFDGNNPYPICAMNLTNVPPPWGSLPTVLKRNHSKDGAVFTLPASVADGSTYGFDDGNPYNVYSGYGTLEFTSATAGTVAFSTYGDYMQLGNKGVLPFDTYSETYNSTTGQGTASFIVRMVHCSMQVTITLGNF